MLKSGREPITIVEIWQDKCCNVFGTSEGCGTCNATVGPCFNTLKTCTSRQDYELGEPLKLRFAEERINLPRDINLIPILKGVTTVPTQINVGSGDKNTSPLGQRSMVVVSLQDIPHSDLLVDPYRDERNYNPLDRGSFWNKWLARNPYYQNRRLVVYDGYVGQNIEDMRSRTFFIDNISGPDARGNVSIKAKDVLKFVSNERAQFPIQSNGLVNKEIGGEASEVEIKNGSISEYDPGGEGSGFIRIGDEVISWSGITLDNGIITLSNLGRGSFKTETDSHSEGDNVQFCKQYNDEPIVNVVLDLMEASGVPSDLIPQAEWETEAERWLNSFNVSVLLTEAFGVGDLLAELTEQCLFYVWWDDFEQKINLRALRPVDLAGGESVFSIDDTNHVIEGSLRIERKPEQRVSRVYTYLRQINPTEGVEDRQNYSRWRLQIDANAEGEEQYGERRIREVFARWLQGDGQAQTVNSRMISRYRNNPEIISFSLDAKDRAIKVADIVDLKARQFTNDFGEEVVKRLQVIKIEESNLGHRQTYTGQFFEFFADYGFIMPNGSLDYSSASDEEKENGCYFAYDESGFPDGRTAYRFI